MHSPQARLGSSPSLDDGRLKMGKVGHDLYVHLGYAIIQGERFPTEGYDRGDTRIGNGLTEDLRANEAGDTCGSCGGRDASASVRSSCGIEAGS
jgi:hypothetical protein